MLPIAPSVWSRVTHRVHFRLREGLVPATASGEILVDSPRANTLLQGAVIGSLLLLGSLFLILYGQIIVSMVQQWWSDPNYGHGFLVPVFVAYLLWRERARISDVSLQGSTTGLAIMFFAIALLVLGILGSEHFTARMSMIVLACGIIVFLAGWRALRSVAFPMSYLIFMIPLPAIIFYQLTFPLQLLASNLGAHGLLAVGVPTIREGNLLILPNCTLEVVEACSGVRSLVSLLTAVVGYAYLCEPRLWKQIVLVAAVVPTVIVSNGCRLVATGVLSYRYGPGVDSGIAHTVLGLVCFACAFFAILLLHRLLGGVPRAQIPDSA